MKLLGTVQGPQPTKPFMKQEMPTPVPVRISSRTMKACAPVRLEDETTPEKVQLRRPSSMLLPMLTRAFEAWNPCLWQSPCILVDIRSSPPRSHMCHQPVRLLVGRHCLRIHRHRYRNGRRHSRTLRGQGEDEDLSVVMLCAVMPQPMGIDSVDKILLVRLEPRQVTMHVVSVALSRAYHTSRLLAEPLCPPFRRPDGMPSIEFRCKPAW